MQLEKLAFKRRERCGSVIQAAAQILLGGPMGFVCQYSLFSSLAAAPLLSAKFFNAFPLRSAAASLDGFDLVEQELAREGTILPLLS